MAPVAGSLELLLNRGLQVNHRAALGEHAPVVGIDHGAAAGGQDDAIHARQAFDRFPFAQPKSRLALLVEDIRDIDPGSGLDISIAVVKGESQEARQMPADGGLARTHGTDEKDIGFGEHGRTIINRRGGCAPVPRALEEGGAL